MTAREAANTTPDAPPSVASMGLAEQARRRRSAPSVLVAIVLALPHVAAADPSSIERASSEIASRFAEPIEPGRVALAVSAPGADGLAGPVETALSGELGRRGFAVVPLRRPERATAEAMAQRQGADWLLLVRASLAPGRREIALAAEAFPVAPNFFLQHAPEVRPGSVRLVVATAPADSAVLALAIAPRPSAPARITLRPLWRVRGRVLAMAVGDALGDGSTAIVIVTSDAVSLHAATGELLARRSLGDAPPAPLAAPVRDPAAAVAIGSFAGGRIAYQLAGAAEGEVLAPAGAVLRSTARLASAALCASDVGPLFGAFAPGKGALADVLLLAPDPRARPRSGRELVAVVAAPRGGPVAYGALGTDYALTLLGPDLAPVAHPIPGVGAGFALADLDGDGVAEIVASSVDGGASDRIRVLRAVGNAETVYASPPVAGAILAGAAGDVTGDGLDDAVLAAVVDPEGGADETQLYLVTADARAAP